MEGLDKLEILDIQDSGFTGPPIALMGLKVLGAVPSYEGQLRDRLNLIVTDGQALRTLQLTFK